MKRKIVKVKANECGFIGTAIDVLLVVGYILDIYKFASCDFASPYKAEVFYGIGILIPPLGGVFGWF